MSRRGSAQLLLLFFRSRRALGWTAGAIAGVAVAAGLLLAGGDLPTPIRGRAGAAGERLGPRPSPACRSRLPGLGPRHDPLSAAKVPRLGLSASVVKDDQGTGRGN